MSRVETGVAQFVGDLPGVFIRGDDATRFAHQLREALYHLETASSGVDQMYSDPRIPRGLRSLAELLESCNMNRWPASGGPDVWVLPVPEVADGS